jgi:2-deoxy-D-gluconate 3-dehydrogenase
MVNTMDLFSLSGRTALVTGATRGIGQSIAIALAEAGADVVLIQRPGSRNDETKRKVEELKRKASIVYADLASPDEMRGLVKRVVDDGHDISIVVNCGGIQSTPRVVMKTVIATE